ncbi:MAG: fumarylacetoacetate hydrolase family protein [Proteobacteria bacterium]|nr:fumarylacetoacetate hydrolase family protein [Pseudomonadota bacterium]
MSYAIGSYRRDNNAYPALVLAGRIYDLAETWRACGESAAARGWIERGVAAMLASWSQVAPVLDELAASAQQRLDDGKLGVQEVDAAAIAAPFVPARIFCAASNYVEHANEMGTVLAAKTDSRPYMFLKTASSVIGPNETVRIPPETLQPDWEVELAVVIGQRARRIKPEHALEHVAGYTIVNDVSARDLNKRSDYPFKHDWFQGKNHDTFCPIGPWIVPARFIRDPQRIKLQLTVNEALMQDGTTAEMIWTVREQIAYLSTIVTLKPGDVIATGTPTGVGMGRGIFLKPGDVMTASVEGIGLLRNPVAAEK